MTAVLMAIKPQYASLIYEGHKRVEWRRRMGSKTASTLETIIVYESAPVSAVTGWIEVDRVYQHDCIKGLRVQTQAYLSRLGISRFADGITFGRYLDYMEGGQRPTSIIIGEAHRHPVNWRLTTHKPPQSYSLISEDLAKCFIDQKTPACNGFYGLNGKVQYDLGRLVFFVDGKGFCFPNVWLNNFQKLINLDSTIAALEARAGGGE